jgi:hypothetical protein
VLYKHFWKQYHKSIQYILYKNSCTRSITHKSESVTIRNLKPEWGGAALAEEEKYQGKGNFIIIFKMALGWRIF